MPAADTHYEIGLPSPERVVEHLVESGKITTHDIEQAESLAAKTNASVLITLNKIGILNDDDLAEALHRVTGLPVQTDPIDIKHPDACRLNPQFMRDTQSLLVSDTGPLLVVDPLDERLLRAASFAIGTCPDLQIIKSGDWLRAFNAHYPQETQINDHTGGEDEDFALELADQNRDAPIVRQVAAWLREAADCGASDVHFDARRNALAVQFRIDGQLHLKSTQPKSVISSVMARIKVIADLDLGERNKPQDGRTTIVVRGRRLDIRVSMIPTIDGESAVVRLLDRPNGVLSLEQLGFDPATQTELDRIVQHKHGMFVVAGPTGSGKTTTLYACIERLKGRGLKILSVEDPVEYHFDHVNQVQISEKAGRDFAGSLRAFLRHDPDVILVGEIRDTETAQVAVQASLSGHLVLATIHAIDAARIRTRLTDMGVEPFKLDASLLGAMAQRLVRTLCPKCKTKVDLTASQSEMFKSHAVDQPSHLYEARGCEACDGYGFSGRTVVADLQTGSQPQHRHALMSQALRLAADGRTSMSEIAGFSES